jgi:hypothetical protein
MPERAFYLWQVRSFTVRLALDFVETLSQHLVSQHLKDPRLNPAEEQGGLLFGRVIDNNTVEVTDFEFIRSKHHRGSSYDLGDGERCSLERYVRSFSNRRGPKPVGYFRTHLRLGLFLDQSDFSVMTDSFSDIPGIALAIRTDRPGPSNAGIFFREDGDIDGTRTELLFPFDAATLRVQGPLEEETPTPTVAGRTRAWAAALKVPSSSLAWGTAAVLALAMTYEFHQNSGGGERIGNVAANAARTIASPRQSQARPEAPAQPDSQNTSNAPPAVFHDIPNSDVDGPNQAHSVPPGVRSPFGASQPRPASPPQQPTNVPQIFTREPAPVAAERPLPPPAPLTAPTPVAQSAAVSQSAPSPERISQPATALLAAPDPPPASTKNTASLSTPVPVPAFQPGAPAAPAKRITVDVSLEPREQSGFKRIAGHVTGHVPLLGRLHAFRNENSRDFVSARPAASLRPRVPANMTQNLEGEVAVDVVVSIDDQGLVKNTEITKGGETSLAVLAADAVRSAPWEPARSGDRNVAMDMVVHYRFNPEE